MIRRRILAPAVAALAALAVGVTTYAWIAKRVPPLPEIGGFVLPEARALDDVALVDSAGQPFAARDFAGHWSFLYFGYTYCPDVCPLSMLELSNLKKLLATRTPGVAAEYYFVSVDPRRDTPERLREYVTYFDPGFHGLTGEPAQIAAFANALGAIYFVPPDQDEQTYVVSHTSSVTLLDPEGRLHAVFTAPHTPEQLAADFAKVLTRYRALTD
jgi:protein SCO1/2